MLTSRERILNSVAVVLLKSVVKIRLLPCQPRQHLPQFGFLRAVAHDHYCPRVDILLAKESVQIIVIGLVARTKLRDPNAPQQLYETQIENVPAHIRCGRNREQR